MSAVPFVCQRCKQPLRIHDSLVDISPAAFDLLAGTVHLPNKNLTKTGSNVNSTTNNSRKPSPARSAQYPADRQSLYDKTTKQQGSQSTPLVKRVIPTTKNGSTPIRTTSSTTSTSTPPNPKANESFVVLTQSQIQKSPTKPSPSVPPESNTVRGTGGNGSDIERRKVSAKLFDAISGRSDIDYPMCTECADILLEIMSGKHVEVKRERDGYLEFIKTLQNEGQVTPEEQAIAEKELEDVPPQIPSSLPW